MPTPDVAKPFKTYAEQIALLRERHLIINDELYAQNILRELNYYRFSAYSLTLRENDIFYEGTTFEDIVSLYEFDKEIRNIVFKYSSTAETVARAYIAYYHAEKHGPLGYLNNQYFESEQFHAEFLTSLFSALKRSKEIFIQHHRDDRNGVYPIWVVSEEMTFGLLSRFYKNMLLGDREDIARQYYGRRHDYIENYLQCTSVMRNIAAHGGRFYNRKRLGPAVSFPNRFKRLADNTSPFAYFYALYELLPDSSKLDLVRSLDKTFRRYPAAQISRLGFPESWNELLCIPVDEFD